LPGEVRGRGSCDRGPQVGIADLSEDARQLRGQRGCCRDGAGVAALRRSFGRGDWAHAEAQLVCVDAALAQPTADLVREQ
jgi:hypothetical protein